MKRSPLDFRSGVGLLLLLSLVVVYFLLGTDPRVGTDSFTGTDLRVGTDSREGSNLRSPVISTVCEMPDNLPVNKTVVLVDTDIQTDKSSINKLIQQGHVVIIISDSKECEGKVSYTIIS